MSAHTAIDYYRQPFPVRNRLRGISLASAGSTADDILRHDAPLRALGLGSLPIHLLVGAENSRRESLWVRPHTWTHAISDGSFVSPAPGIFVSSPEFSYAQAASTTHFIDLVWLGYELCASYVLDAQSPFGIREREPISSIARIESFVESQPDFPGRARALGAILYVAERAASPREVMLSMALSLPKRMGGYGIPVPTLNQEVRLKLSGGGEQVRRLDCSWEKARFGLEYDSDEGHLSKSRMSSDSRREKQLRLGGIGIERVTNGELSSEEGRDMVARIVCMHLGMRYREDGERTRVLRRRVAERILSGAPRI